MTIADRSDAELAEIALQAELAIQRMWGPGSTFIVTVTLEDIRQGKPGNPLACPIALAGSRGLNPVTQFCQMGTALLQVVTNGTGIASFVNDEAAQWVRRFDVEGKGAVAPERFRFVRVPA